MSSFSAEKRPRDAVDDGAECEFPAAKAKRANEEHPSHPHYILDHLVKHVLPERCRNDKVTAYYKAQLEHPEATIAECKSLLADWVLEMWTKGTLWRLDKLKRRAVSVYPKHGAVYLSIVVVEGDDFRYAGQTNDSHARIVEMHESASYRNSHPKFLYMLRERAEEVFYLLPIDNAGLKAGPVHNILEQWIALVFRALQPSELKHNLPAETLRWIPADEMHKGVNVREPLAQGFSFNDFPMRGTSFKYSPISLKREWYEVHRNHEIVVRSEGFLRGDVFSGSFWNAPGWYGKADYEFQIWSVKLRIGKSWIDRCDIETIRVWCDLRPEGETHPHNITRGSGVRLAYNDPALRLGIRVSGIRNGDKLEGWSWLMMDGSADKATPRLNRLVDWLDGLDTEELRPRRWYPANKRLGRPRCGYTLHPLDVGEKWRELTDDST